MRRRNMFYATGLPGWMRFGYSPGWGGMPPCAQVLTTGPGRFSMGPMAPGAGIYAQPDRAAQLAFLQSQLEMLQQQLQAVTDQIAALEEQA